MPERLTITADHVGEIEKTLRELAKVRVLVGIPESNAARRDSKEPDNATLGYIHEFGSPARNIPARPFLHPGVRDSEDQWLPYLRAAGTAAFEGDANTVEQKLMQAGLVAVAAVKARITAGIPPPLADATIRARRRRSPGSSYRRKATTQADVTPLVDTAQLLNSLTAIIERR